MDVAAGDGRGDDNRHETRQEEVGDQIYRRDVAAHPQHDGRHVADGRPCAAAVGRDDDHAGENPPLLLVGDQPSQQHDHDDRGGHVVQGGRHEKGDDRQQPHQLALVARGNMVGDDVEPAVAVYQVHDGHGPDQENEDFAGVAELLHQFGLDFGIVAQQAENRPDRSGHQQGDGRFVDPGFVLQRDEEITHHEEQNHCSYHIYMFLRKSVSRKVNKLPGIAAVGWGIFCVSDWFLRFFVYLCTRFRANV